MSERYEPQGWVGLGSFQPTRPCQSVGVGFWCVGKDPKSPDVEHLDPSDFLGVLL